MFDKVHFSADHKSEVTYKERVEEFWAWFEPRSDRFYQTIDDGECASLVTEVSDACQRMLPGLSWVFGPGLHGGHSLTLSGEGNVLKQLLADYWLELSPELPRWTFYAARQPSDPERLRTLQIGIGVDGDQHIGTEDFWLRTHVDEDAEVIDIVAWHPLLESVPDEHHYQILFLLLDEALGEFGTQTWLGQIAVERMEKSESNQTIASLPEFIKNVENYHGWEKHSPLDCYSIYQFGEQSDMPRGDTVAGATCIVSVLSDFFEHGGELLEDPLEELGAELVYVAIDSVNLPEGEQAEARGQMEDLLDEALGESMAGRVLGGAYGLKETYIDLILFHGETSREIVQQTLAEMNLRGEVRIVPFAKG
jgi:hypothetical protein